MMKTKLFSSLWAVGLLAGAGLCPGVVRADYAATVSTLDPVAYYRLSATNAVPAELMASNRGTLGAAFNGEYRANPVRGLAGAIVGDADTAIAVSGGQVVVPFDAAYNLETAFTIEAWIRPAVDTGGLTAPLNAANMGDPRAGWLLYQNGGSGWSFRMYNQNGLSVSLELVTTDPVVAGIWYHVVAVYDGTEAALYIDGVAAATGSPIGSPKHYVANPGSPFVMGARSDFAFPWEGALDEVAIYNRALTGGEVQENYQNGRNPNRTTPYDALVEAKQPALYYRLGEPALELPIARNSGRLGAVADGTYLPGTTSGVPGPQMPAVTGFETTNVAAAFNGTSGSIKIPGLDLETDALTMVCWLKRDGRQPARAGIMHNRKVTAPEVKATGLGFQDDGLALSYNWEDLGAAYNFNPGFVPPDQTWTFFAVTVAPTEAVMYMGTAAGLQAATNTLDHFPHNFSGAALDLGWDNYQPTRVFRGVLDEFALFDRTLTPAQVRSLFEAALPAILSLTRTADPVFEGATVTFRTSVAGPAPITYQWRKDGAALPGATGDTLVLADVTLGDSGAYDLVATTGGQTLTSPVNHLEVVSAPPTLTQTPASALRFLNGTVRFVAAATGSQPLTFQWRHGENVIPGATAATLTLTDLQPADAGEYTVVVSNPFGTQQAQATLTLVTPTKYAAVAADAGPVGYWRLDEASGTTAYDYWGGRDGTANAGVTVNEPGPRPAAQKGFDDTNAAYLLNGTSGKVVIPPLNLNKATATIVTWIKPDGAQMDYAGVVFSRGAAVSGIDYKGSTDQLGYHWNDAANTYSWDSGLYPEHNQWNFVALVVEPAQATMYLDSGTGFGLQASVNVVTHGTSAFDGTVQLGQDGTSSRLFKGAIDEVTVYDRALSEAEITRLRDAGFNGTTFTTPVQIVEQPKGQTILVGTAYTLSGKASGSLPLTYQWKKDGQDLPGAIRSQLVFPSAQESDSGTYQLFVTQNTTVVSTTPVTLTVKPVPAYVNLAENLVVHLPFDGGYQDTSGRGNHGTAQGTPTIVPGKIGSGALDYRTVVEGGVTTADYVTLGTPADLAFGPGASFSVAFWIQFTGSPGDLPFLANNNNSMGDTGVTLAPSYNQGGWSWGLNDVVAPQPWPGIGLYDPVQNTLNDGVWHHLVHVFDRTGDATTFLDGVKVHAMPIASAAGWDFNTGNPWNIGQASGTYAEAGSFRMDDLGIWRRVLSDYDAQSIYIVGQNHGRSFDSTAPPEVRLSIGRTEAGLRLEWSSGTLEAAPTVSGPWNAVTGANPPSHTVQPTEAAGFYRVKL